MHNHFIILSCNHFIINTIQPLSLKEGNNIQFQSQPHFFPRLSQPDLHDPFLDQQYNVLICIWYKPQGSAPKAPQDPCAVPKIVYSRVASSSLYTYNTNPSYTYNRYSFLLYNSHCFVHYSQDLVSLSETSEFNVI